MKSPAPILICVHLSVMMCVNTRTRTRYFLRLLGKYFEEANNIPILTEKPMWMRFETFRFISVA